MLYHFLSNTSILVVNTSEVFLFNGTQAGKGNVGMINALGYLGPICDNSWNITEVSNMYVFHFDHIFNR